MLINEKQLSLMDPESRKYLQQEMEKFLNNEHHIKQKDMFLPKNRQSNLTLKDIKTIKYCASQVAQSVEQRTENPRVGGSIPPWAPPP